MDEYRHKGVDIGSKWTAGMSVTEVRLDEWCEGSLRQQRNGCGGCASMHNRSERVESPGVYVTERVSRGCSFGPTSRALVVITWRGVGCRYKMLLG